MCVKINAIYFAENTQNIAKNLRQNSTKSDRFKACFSGQKSIFVKEFLIDRQNK